MALNTEFCYYGFRGIGSHPKRLCFCELAFIESLLADLLFYETTLSPPNKILMHTMAKKLSSI